MFQEQLILAKMFTHTVHLSFVSPLLLIPTLKFKGGLVIHPSVAIYDNYTVVSCSGGYPIFYRGRLWEGREMRLDDHPSICRNMW